MERNLAAVLAADVADYSRLMGEDATRTLAALRRLRAELFGPMVAGHRGRLVKSMGDGWIVTFASAVDAVTCAMRLQDKMVLEDAIQLRVGVHLGDVSIEDEDVFGDGVNVAARLEALTKPGGVTISDAVFSTLDGTLRPAFDDGGMQSLKNIARPVQVWSRGGLTGAAEAMELDKKAGFPVLDIVPVTVTDTRGDLRDLANALTHELEAYLSSLRWLRVSVVKIPRAGAITLSADLRASGDRIRLESRVRSPDGRAIWSGKHDGQIGDVFDWQDETGSAVASQAVAAICELRTALLEAKLQSDWTWQDQVVYVLSNGSMEAEAFSIGLDSLSQAIAMSPPSSYPYEIMLALVATASSLGYRDIVADYGPHLGEWSKTALDLSGRASSSRILLAFSGYVQTGDSLKARQDLSAVLRDLPFDPDVLLFGGYLFQFLGEPENALACFRRFDTVALLDAYRPGVRSGTGACYVQMGQFEQALPELDEAIRLMPSYVAAHRWRIAALAQLGRLDEAREALADHDRLLPGQTIALVRHGSRYADTPGLRNYFDGLRMAGMPE